MNDKIFSPEQKQFLSVFAKSKVLSSQFYLSGGTALAGYYIPYRFSEDLDFFSEQEISVDEIVVFIKSNKTNLNYQEIDINTSFNRNLIYLKFKVATLKTEFTYYPFTQIEKPKEIGGIKIDSIIDIAVNKVFTIYQKPRIRDFTDLYMIHQKYRYELPDLMDSAKIKFDWHIDPLKMGSQLLMVNELQDYPRLIDQLDANWHNYFVEEAKKLEKNILS